LEAGVDHGLGQAIDHGVLDHFQHAHF